MVGAIFVCVCISDIYSTVYSYFRFEDISCDILHEKFNAYFFAGKRIPIPVGAPLVYRDNEDDQNTVNLVGGLADELADDALDTLIGRMDLPVDHLCYLAGMCHDSPTTLILPPQIVLYKNIYCVK